MAIPNKWVYYWTSNSKHHFLLPFVLSVKSVLKVEKPDNVFIYYNDPEPNDRTWIYLKTLPVTFIKFKPYDFKFDFLSDKFYEILSTKIDSKENPYRHFHLSDIARYLHLYKSGGVYYDFDTLSIKSIQPFMKEDIFLPSCGDKTCQIKDLKGEKEQSSLANGNLGVISDHPFYRKILELADQKLTTRESWDKTLFGPPLVAETKVYYPETRVLDPLVFHCVGHTGKSKRYKKIDFYYKDVYKTNIEIPEEAYCLHMHTGKTQSRRQMSLRDGVKYLIENKENNTFSRYYFPYLDEELINWMADF